MDHSDLILKSLLLPLLLLTLHHSSLKFWWQMPIQNKGLSMPFV